VTRSRKLNWYLCHGVSADGKEQYFHCLMENESVLNMHLDSILTGIIKINRIRFNTERFKTTPKQMAFLFQQLAQTTKSGLDILSALKLAAKQKSAFAISALVNDLEFKLLLGWSFSDAIKTHPASLSIELLQLIKAGEQTGKLPEAFEHVSVRLQSQLRLKKTLIKRLSYPVLLIVMSLVISMGMLIWVVPTFTAFYAGNEKSLPELTQLFIEASRFVTRHWPGIIMLLTSTFALLFVLPKKFCSVDKFVRRVPIMGVLYWPSNWHQFFYVMSLLYTAGIPIHKVLQSAVYAAPGLYFQQSTMPLVAKVTSGDSLTSAFENMVNCPPTVLHIIANAERTGTLSAALEMLSEQYNEQLKDRLNAICGMIEPITVILMGGLIAIMMLSMYLPIFDLGNVL